MPKDSPLTKSPMPLLSDSPNIESSIQPAILELEKHAIPRFSSVSARNNVFSSAGISPRVGQVVFITNLGPRGYQVWTGSKWEEFGDYTLLREYAAWNSSHYERTSVVFGNVSGMSIPVNAGLWYVDTHIIYSTENNYDTWIAFNFNFPGSSSRIRAGAIGRSPIATGGNSRTTHMNVNHQYNRTSGDAEHQFGGSIGDQEGFNNSTFARISGTLRIAGSSSTGLLRFQVARRGQSGHKIRVWTGSVMTARKISNQTNW